MRKNILLFVILLFSLNCKTQIESEFSIEDFMEEASDSLSVLTPQIKIHQSGSSATFVFATDFHNKAFYPPYKNNPISQKISNIRYVIDRININVGLDCLVLGGDYIWNTTETTKQTAIDALRAFGKTMGKIENLPVLCLMGNHDDNSLAGPDNTLSKDEFYKSCASYFNNSNIVTDNDRGCYGYFDIVRQKIRVIFLNTVDLPTMVESNVFKYKVQWDTGISQKQLDFVVGALSFTEPGWGVVIISHHPITSISGYDINNVSSLNPHNGGDLLYGVIKAFKERGVYQKETTGDFAKNVDVDFTANASNEVICLLNGHIHCDRNAIKDEMLFVTTTSSTLGNHSDLNTDGSLYKPQERTTNESAFDVITIDRSEGKIYFDRWGFGVSRKFKYATCEQE